MNNEQYNHQLEQLINYEHLKRTIITNVHRGKFNQIILLHKLLLKKIEVNEDNKFYQDSFYIKFDE